jgi:hypothetical protein
MLEAQRLYCKLRPSAAKCLRATSTELEAAFAPTDALLAEDFLSPPWRLKNKKESRL